MAILTSAAFLKLYDTARCQQLATEYSASTGKSQYDSTIISTIVAQADALVSAELCRQYTTTEMAADAAVVRATAAIAMYYLESRRPSQMPESVKYDYETAMNLIKRLQEGTAKLTAVSELLPTISDDSEPTIALNSGYFDGGPADVEEW